MKVGFFDRDGTIIEDYPDSKWSYIDNPVFFANAIRTLKEVQQRGYKIIIITNQYLINEGFISLQQYKKINKRLLSELSDQGINILDVFYCPHRRNEGCSCMKPQPGMITEQ